MEQNTINNSVNAMKEIIVVLKEHFSDFNGLENALNQIKENVDILEIVDILKDHFSDFDGMENAFNQLSETISMKNKQNGIETRKKFLSVCDKLLEESLKIAAKKVTENLSVNIVKSMLNLFISYSKGQDEFNASHKLFVDKVPISKSTFVNNWTSALNSFQDKTEKCFVKINRPQGTDPRDSSLYKLHFFEPLVRLATELAQIHDWESKVDEFAQKLLIEIPTNYL